MGANLSSLPSCAGGPCVSRAAGLSAIDLLEDLEGDNPNGIYNTSIYNNSDGAGGGGSDGPAGPGGPTARLSGGGGRSSSYFSGSGRTSTGRSGIFGRDTTTLSAATEKKRYYDRSILDSVPALEEACRRMESFVGIQEGLKSMIEVEEWMHANYGKNELTETFLQHLSIALGELQGERCRFSLTAENYTLTQDDFVTALSRMEFADPKNPTSVEKPSKKSGLFGEDGCDSEQIFLDKEWIAQAWLRTASSVRGNDFRREEIFGRIINVWQDH